MYTAPEARQDTHSSSPVTGNKANYGWWCINLCLACKRALLLLMLPPLPERAAHASSMCSETARCENQQHCMSLTCPYTSCYAHPQVFDNKPTMSRAQLHWHLMCPTKHDCTTKQSAAARLITSCSNTAVPKEAQLCHKSTKHHPQSHKVRTLVPK